MMHAFPALPPEAIRRLRRQFYLHFTDVWLETIKGLSMPGEEYEKRVKILNPELYTGFIEQGRAVMVLSSHRANWEWLTPSHSYQLAVPIDAVFKKVKSPSFNDLMLCIRGRFGARMVEKDDLLRDSLRRHKIPRLLAIMSDQTPSSGLNNQWFPFMNRPTPFYNASEKLARKLGMPVLYADMHRTSRGHYQVTVRLITDTPANMPENGITEAYVQLIEEGIRRSPADYLWSHKRWKHKPPESVSAMATHKGQ